MRNPSITYNLIFALLYSIIYFFIRTINLRNKANENDYNKLIANNLLFEKAKYNLIQTPVSNTNNFYKKIEDIQLGNIIFEEIRRNNNKNILYAVTSKNLDNMHFVGQELYFEYIKNIALKFYARTF